MNSLPKKINDLIDVLTGLPGIGQKSAARIVFFLQKAPKELNTDLADAIVDAKINTRTCKICYNLSEEEICTVCADEKRDRSKLLVVEDPLDLIAIERAGAYQGFYHVLGGVISPMNGIGPDEIRIRELLERLKKDQEESEIELIIATNPNMEGEATAVYIQNEIVGDKKLKNKVKISRLARGLTTGADIDFTDDMTIRKAIEGRVNM